MINYDQLAELTAKAHSLLDEVEKIMDHIQSELQTAKAAEEAEAQLEPAPTPIKFKSARPVAAHYWPVGSYDRWCPVSGVYTTVQPHYRSRRHPAFRRRAKRAAAKSAGIRGPLQ